jgi:hypothetical protein
VSNINKTAVKTTTSPDEIISEYQLCTRWNRGPRWMLDKRTAGKMPKHHRGGHNCQQVFYRLEDVIAFEQNPAQ